MDLDTLALFLHLSRTLHFGRTSRECHVSPSALSRTIKRLEEELGVTLLTRDNRSVALTPAGEQVQVYASEALARHERLQKELARAAVHLRGTLSLFCSVTASHSVLPTLLNRFREAYPDVTIRLETGHAIDALEWLQAGRADVTVAALPEHVPRGLVSSAITHTPLLFVAPKAACEVSSMVEQASVDWAAVPFILPERGIARQSIDHWFRAKGITPRVYGEASGNEALLALISLGCGVGIVPGLVMERSPLSSQVRSLSVKPRLPDFRVGLCAKRSSLKQDVVAAFWESISSDQSGMSQPGMGPRR